MKPSKSVAVKIAEDEALSWLVRINKQTITDAEQQAFLHWLNTSSLNQAAYIKAEQIWAQGKHYAAASVRQPVTIEWRNLAIACSLLLVVLVGFFLYPAKTQHYETFLGQQKVIELDDGSRITLNTKTQVEVIYAEKKREIHLTQGEAFFDVEPDANRPFDVVVKAGVVRVLGTHFSVKSMAEDALVQVESGRVALGKKPLFASAFQTNLVLHDNQGQSFVRLEKGLDVESVNPASAFAWRNKRLVYQSLPLKEVIADLNRYIKHPIVIKNEGLAETKVTAMFQLDDLLHSTQIIQSSLDVKLHYNDNQGVYLLTK